MQYLFRMIPSTKTIAPFGSTVGRFGNITLHPNLDSSGLYTKRPLGCDPCLYHPIPVNEICQSNRSKKSKDPWRYKNELEAWSKNLGYRNQKILKEKKWFKSILGPAWHDVKDTFKYVLGCKEMGFERTPRFTPSKNTLPGPGTYYKSKPYKSLYGPHSIRPTFEREDPCRFKDRSLDWSLAPNRYNIVDKESIEQKPKKVVSLRGPYDLFTGKRDESTIKNHFSTSKCSAATWPIMLKGTLTKYENSRSGVMNKTSRSVPYRGRTTLLDLSMCFRNPKEPGPAHYDTDMPKVFKQCAHPFNSSYDKPCGYIRAVVWPGVGRYNVTGISCGITGHGHRHVFLSKQKRTIGAIMPQPMNTF